MLIENDLFFYKTFKKTFDDKRTRSSHKTAVHSIGREKDGANTMYCQLENCHGIGEQTHGWILQGFVKKKSSYITIHVLLYNPIILWH